MSAYPDSTTIDADTPLLATLPLARSEDLAIDPDPQAESVSLPSVPIRSPFDSASPKPFLQILGLSTLTGASLTLIAKPVFWLDAKYLSQPPTLDRPLGEVSSTLTGSTTHLNSHPNPETIVVPPAASPRFVAVNPNSLQRVAPASPISLKPPQGFRQPSVAQPGAIELPPPPMPATLSATAKPSPVAAASQPKPASAATNTAPPIPQLDLSAVLPAPPTVTHTLPNRPPSVATVTTPPAAHRPSAGPSTQTFAAATLPELQTAPPTVSPQPPNQALPWENNLQDLPTPIPEFSPPLETPNAAAQPLETTPPVTAPPVVPPPITATIDPSLTQSELPTETDQQASVRLPSVDTEPLAAEALPPSDPIQATPSLAARPLPTIQLPEASTEVPPDSAAPPLETPNTLTEIPSLPTSPSTEAAPVRDAAPVEDAGPVEQAALPWLNPPIDSIPPANNPLANNPTADNLPTVAPPADNEPAPTILPDSLSNQAVLAPHLTQTQSTPAAPEVVAVSPELIEVQQFMITGNTVFDETFLEEIAWGAVNAGNAVNQTATVENDATHSTSAPRPPATVRLSRADLVRASEAVTQYYIDQQYINSGAYVPENAWTEGIVEIRVIEGSLAAIDVNVEGPGLFNLSPNYVANRLRAATQGSLNLDRLVEGVRLLEQDPLIEQITAEIAPGTETGTSVLNVDVIQDDGLDVSLSTSNERSPSIGSFGQQTTISQANLLGRGDRLSLGFERTSGLNSWEFGYSLPLNARNGTLSFDFSISNSRIIEAPFNNLDLESNSQTYELTYRQPLVQTPSEELALSLTAARRNSQGNALVPFRGADNNGRTQLTVLRFGQEWVKRNPKQVFALLSELSLGLDAFGSTINESRPDGRFFLWRGHGQWVRRLGDDSLFLIRGNVQLADGPLVPSEQLGLGGFTTVRGYRPNSILSDNGWLLSSEVQLPILRIPSVKGVLQVAPFVDIGGGWNNGDFGDPNPSVLASTGLGFLWRMGENFNARLNWGIPLISGESIKNSGLQFSINFFPF